MESSLCVIVLVYLLKHIIINVKSEHLQYVLVYSDLFEHH